MGQGLGVSINEGFGVRIWDLHAGKMRQSRQRQDKDTKAKTKTKTQTFKKKKSKARRFRALG